MFGNSRFLRFLRLPGDRLPLAHFYTMLLLVACVFFSRYGLTVSILLLLMMTLASQFLHKEIRLVSVKFFVLPAIVLLTYLFSIYYSSDLAEGLAAAKVKALFLVIPYILLSLNSISDKQKQSIYHYFVLLCVITACWSLFQIPYHQLDLWEMYAKGEVIPTIIHHIRFSLLIAFAAIFCWMLTFRRARWRLMPQYGYFILAVFLSVYLHVLAVRSGLVGFYGGMFFLVGLSFANKKNLMLKSAAVGITIAAVILAFNFVPSLKAKIQYTFYSLKQFAIESDDMGIYSDSRRLISYEAAIQLIKDRPLTGVGIGDIKRDINAWYDIHYPTIDQQHLHPHNQFLFTAAAVGIPAALFLLVFTFLLLIRHIRHRDWLLVSFNIILMISFLVEDTLEMQIGVIVYLFFNYLGWQAPKEGSAVETKTTNPQSI